MPGTGKNQLRSLPIVIFAFAFRNRKCRNNDTIPEKAEQKEKNFGKQGKSFRRVLTTETGYDLIRLAKLNRKFCIAKPSDSRWLRKGNRDEC